MKKYLILALFIFLVNKATAQVGVSFHASTTPFVGVNYRISPHFLSEIRVIPNLDFIEETQFEAMGNYIFNNNDEVEIYSGAGVLLDFQNPALLIPLGINLYPFENKRFGFQVELSAIISEDIGSRASGGFRYIFTK